MLLNSGGNFVFQLLYCVKTSNYLKNVILQFKYSFFVSYSIDFFFKQKLNVQLKDCLFLKFSFEFITQILHEQIYLSGNICLYFTKIFDVIMQNSIP